MTKTEFIMAYNIGHRDGKAGDYCPNEYDDMQMIDAEPCEDAISRGAFEQVCKERDIAIEQLHELGYEWGQKIEPCDYAISRQAAKEAIRKAFPDLADRVEINSVLNDLPSVTPKQTEITLESAIDYLHSIGWMQKHDKAMTECAEKQRTGHWIETADEYYKSVNEYGGGVDENTPYFTDNIGCSVCLAMFSTIDNETERFKYCPNCGARMESEEQA